MLAQQCGVAVLGLADRRGQPGPARADDAGILEQDEILGVLADVLAGDAETATGLRASGGRYQAPVGARSQRGERLERVMATQRAAPGVIAPCAPAAQLDLVRVALIEDHRALVQRVLEVAVEHHSTHPVREPRAYSAPISVP